MADVQDYDFNKDVLPVINNVVVNKQLSKLTEKLVKKVDETLHRTLNCTIVLYLGLCNGAGWVLEIANETYIMLGIEKILELN